MSEKAKNAFEAYKKRNGSSEISTPKSPSFGDDKAAKAFEKYQIRNNGKPTIDQSYIENFLSDANSFLGSVEEDYGKIAWGTASSLYDTKSKAAEELTRRSNSIRIWLDQNKDRLDEETYNSFSSALDEFHKNTNSVVDSFKSASDYYSQFESEAQYKDAVKLNELYSMSSDEILPYLNKGETVAYTTSGGQNVSWQQLYDKQKKKEETDALYAGLSSSGDWDEYVQKGASIENPTMKEAEGWWRIGQWRFGAEDVGNIVTYSRDNANHITLGDMNGTDLVGDARYTLMSDEEVSIYNYYLAKYGNEKAGEYLDSIDKDLTDRYNSKLLEGMAQVAAESPVLSSVFSVGMNLFAGAEYIGDAIKYAKTGETDTNFFAQGASTIRGTVSENTDWMIGNWDAFDFLYNTGMSAADSITSMALLGNAGGVALGLSAAAQGTNDALARGADNKHAFWNGFASGVFEGLFETVSIGSFNALKEGATTTFKQFAKNIGKSMLVNASEETLTEIANIAYDWVANGDFSQWETSIRQYMQSGMSESEAKKKVALELGAQIAESGASGALMGFGFGAAGSGTNYVSGSRAAKDAYGSGRSLVEESLERASEGSEARVFAEAYKAALDGGKNLSGGDLYRLSEAYETDIINRDTAKIKAAAAERLAYIGEDGDIDQLSSIIAKQVKGEKLTADEKSILRSSYAGERVANELNPENIASGVYTSEWTEKIGTERINAGAYNKGLYDLAMEQTGATVGEETVSATEDSTPTKEIVPEAKNTVSDDGKTVLIDTNEEVEIQGIASIENGKVKLRTNKGEVDAENISFGTETEALLYEAVTDMSTEAARNLVEAYDPSAGISASEYIHGFRDSYRYGFMGFAESELAKGVFTKGLSEAQRHRAYVVGKNAGEAAVQEAQRARTEAKKSGENAAPKKGKVFINGKEYSLGDKTGLGAVRDASVKGTYILAEVLGTNVHFYESYKNKEGKRVYRDENGNVVHAPHGFYTSSDGSIHIDLNAGAKGEGLILYTVAHELTHFIRDWSPAKFKVFADFLLENYAKKGKSVEALVQAQIEKAAKNGREISFDEAYEEVIADSCQAMLEDGSAIQKIAELKAKDQSLWQKIKSFIKDIVAKIKKAYAGLDPYSAEGRFVKNQLDTFEQLQSLWVDALVDAGETYSAVRDALGENSTIKVNEDGEFLMGKTEDGKVLLNDRTWDEGGRETLRATLALEGYSDEDINAALTIMDGKHKLVEQLNKEFIEQDKISQATLTTDLKTGKAVLSALVSNGDYPVNIDLLMVCKKRQAYQRVINRLCETGLIKQATLDSLAIAEINKILGKYGFETACLGCFVESRRIRIQEWAETICSEWNGIVDKMVGKGKAKSFDFASETFVKDLSDEEIVDLTSDLEAAYERDGLHYGRMKVVKKMEQLLREVPSLRKHLSVADLITPQGRTHLKQLSSELNSLVACRYGSNTPKIVQDFNPYNHELAQYGTVPTKYKSLREYLYAIGGARMQSFSDFIVENWFDYCQIVADLAARKLPMHTYTKEIVLAKLFGMTGIKINMSLIPDIDKSLGKEYAGLTRNAKGELELIWGDKDRYKATGGKSYMQSINFADAVELMADPRYSANVGTIAVGVSDLHIRMMLDDPRIRMIIPYHSSGMNPIFAHLVGTEYYNDYTDVQNTTVKQLYDSNGNAVSLKLEKSQKDNLASGFEFNAVLQELGDARAAAKAYLEWCADASKHSITINGETYTAVLKPKFEQFSGHENYYKVLEDFNTYDSITEEAAPQGDVQQTYPEDFDDILRDELTVRENYRQKQEPKWDAAMSEIEGYLKKHTKAETKAYAKEHGIKLSKKDMKLSDRDSDHSEAALSEFGTTTDFAQAGFVLQNGRMLKLSMYGQKGVQHKRIESVFSELKGDDAVVRFLQEGNIRIKADAYGVEVGAEKAPSVSQLNTLSKFISSCLRGKGIFYLDITDANGRDVASVAYYSRNSTEEVIYDIKGYYERGRIPKGGDVLYSDRDSEEALFSVRAELEKVTEQEREAKKKLDSFDATEQQAAVVDALTKEGVTAEEKDRVLAEYNKWSEESGYSAAYNAHETLRKRREELYREQQQMEKNLSKQILSREYTPEEVKGYVSKAVRKFHTTSRLKCAAYLLTTGSMLDFSEGQGYRVKDHREIAEILDLPEYAQYSDGMTVFMNMGNIRLQTYGVDIASMPNDKQISALRGIISEVMRESDGFTVDFSKPDGNTDGSVEYPKGVSSSRIISDIRNYFETGNIPEYNSSLSQFRYSDRVTDSETLDFLENQEHVTVYRAMQVIDGKLYPPMNAYTYDENGKKVLMPPSEIGAWEQSVERPDLIDPKTGKFKLDKGKVDSGKRGTAVPAAYNPYIHTSLSMLNDQFTSAYQRSNLVVVKGVVPKSELTSGYRAQYAKDTVGETEWHSGVVSTQLPESRKVILSRWFKPVEIMSDDAVAQGIKEMLGDTGIEIPYNVVSPKLRRSLENLGVPIGEGRGIRNLPAKSEVKYSDRNPREVTEQDVRDIFDNIDSYHKDSYVPVRINTPQALIDAAKKRGDIIDNLPVVMQAKKAQQAMSDEAPRSSIDRAHGLSTDDMIAILRAMDDPTYIVYQENGRYVEIVRFETEAKKRAIAVLEIGENKNAIHMNGYEGGTYQVLVTAFVPDSYQYIKDILGNKKNAVLPIEKKKGVSQRSSGSQVPSLLNESPFFEAIISQDSDSVKRKFSDREFPSNAEEIAKEYFGTTQKWSETGWLLRDGSQLDFSGRHWERYPELEIALGESYYNGKRNVEHLEIAEAFPNLRDFSSMEYRGEHLDGFLRRGNIRVVGKGCVDLQTMPTDEQFEKLQSYFRENIDKHIVVGIGLDGLEFRAGTNASTIIEGIRDYFTNNRSRQSDLMRFHTKFSDRDSYAPVFYSHMGKTIDEIKIAKMGAGGVVPYLKGRGVKDEEIKWSGIEAFLEGKKSVTKEELQEFVAGSQLQIVEQMSGDEENTHWSEYKLDGGSNYRELVFQMPNSTFSNQAMRTHWGQDAEGVLAHARIQDFDTADGKMLFIEEIQSDWHNEGAKEGYFDSQEDAKLEALGAKVNDLFLEVEDYSVEMTGMAGEWEYIEKTAKGVKLLREYRAAKAAYDNAMNEAVKKIPDAPFRDTYHEYVLKRLIRMAAEEGYDIIGWTTADIQSQRWSDEYAEGYRIEYDQDIPKFLRKYGKRWGATVGQMYLNSDKNAALIETQEEMIEDLESDLAGLDDNRRRTVGDALQARINRHLKKIEELRGAKVWSMPITDAMKQSVLHEGQPMYSDRSDSDISNRELLANALESAATNDIERRKLALYKEKIALINAEEKHLHELKERIGELSFAKGKKDVEQIKRLQFEAKQTENRINTYDRQLLALEASAPLKALLEREKKMAYKKAEQKGKDALAAYRERAARTQRELLRKARESRQKGIDGRRRTEMRHRIKKVVTDLDHLLRHGTKERNVKLGLQAAVASALEAVNMDTIAADERIAKLEQELMKAKTPEKVQEISRKIDHIREQGDRMEAKLEALRRAYVDIKNSEQGVPDYYKQEATLIADRVDSVLKKVGNTPLRNMSLSQLEEVHNLYQMVLTTVSNVNKLFVQGKLDDLHKNASAIMQEEEAIKPLKEERLALGDWWRKQVWNELIPVYAFEKLGSKTLTKFFWETVKGQNTFATDISEAKAFSEAAREKFGYGKWDLNKIHEFNLEDGRTFRVSLRQMMSIYAYSKREQALEHMRVGGFFFNDKATFRKEKGILKIVKSNESGYTISEDVFQAIRAAMTQEQIQYVDEMQDYLTKMGGKGNEVSRVLWGIDIFKEKVYFPLKSSRDFIYQANQPAQESSLKNDGMTKETIPHASNPIVLEDFDDVWASHVERMSKYHAFVLPIENLNKLMNYGTWVGTDSVAVSTMIRARHSDAANEYITQFIRDLNGASSMDGVSNPVFSFFNKFKKTAVAASLSVVVQQPTAILRASAVIDPKYFVGKPSLNLNEKWEELQKYAPIAIIKDIGGFDAGGGRQITEWLNADTKRGLDKVMGKVDDITMLGAALGDKVGWTAIWEAVKRETLHNNPKLSPKSEEFLKIAGDRFTEVIVLTQVYDSTLSRSGFMRSKHESVKMMTSFMGEPTVSFNMLMSAVTQAKNKRITKKQAARTIGAVYASVLAASIAASMVYALRDDDDDEAFLEKFAESLSGKLKDEINPLNMLPIMRDIMSILDGWDVERTDVAVFKDLKDAFDGLFSENKSAWRKVEDFAGAIASSFGIPLKNVLRTGREMYNIFENIFDSDTPTGAGIKDSIVAGITGNEKSNGQKLYEAILSGDQKQIERVSGRFKNQTAIDTAIRKALRDNDPRVKEAAQAIIDEDFSKYTEIANEMVDEGYFSEANIVAAIRSEINALSEDEEETEETEDKEVSIYEMDYFYSAAVGGDTVMAHAIKEDIIRTKVANGKEREEAEKSFNSSFQGVVRDEYDAGSISESEAIRMLVSYGGKTEAEAKNKVQYWDFKQGNPDTYVSEYWIDAYNEDVASTGVSLETFIGYKNAVKDIEGEGAKAKKMAVIDSLPITNAQKDALYFAEGWAESKLWEAPWR